MRMAGWVAQGTWAGSAVPAQAEEEEGASLAAVVPGAWGPQGATAGRAAPEGRLGRPVILGRAVQAAERREVEFIPRQPSFSRIRLSSRTALLAVKAAMGAAASVVAEDPRGAEVRTAALAALAQTKI